MHFLFTTLCNLCLKTDILACGILSALSVFVKVERRSQGVLTSYPFTMITKQNKHRVKLRSKPYKEWVDYRSLWICSLLGNNEYNNNNNNLINNH